jgi:DNA modification methylase
MRKQDKVISLGKEFNSEDERREYFRNELRSKLPELKKIDGFPIGEDEDIINLSDPPFYTACPNPWLNDFIDEWEKGKENIKGRKKDFHVDEPYASDVSEGKNNPIYNAHSYHTKVPHPAIMRYILHYTQPGDIVLDGFAGTGMTGVAAQLCMNPDAEIKYLIEKERRNLGMPDAVWGLRRVILGDISPIASFIDFNYNTPVEVDVFEREASQMLSEVESECGWMYETKHTNGKVGKINYTVWSDVFTCTNCQGEIVFWHAAVDRKLGEVRDEFICPSCSALHTKRSVEKKWITSYDTKLRQTIRLTKTVPVLLNYTVAGKRYEKSPDSNDLALIQKIDETEVPYWFPIDKLVPGDKTGDPFGKGINHTHQFYYRRELHWLACLFEKSRRNYKLMWLAISIVNTITKMYRYVPQKPNYNGQGGGMLSGTLYIPSLIRSLSASTCVERSYKRLIRAHFKSANGNFAIQTSSSSAKCQQPESVDYIFTDPPFGANIMYSELSFLWESWLKVRTNNRTEAIENKTQGKSLLDYQRIMEECFKEYYRLLKPGKWMTVEFSNTGAAVWNSIQTALQRAGFVVSNVNALDKKQGSFNAVTNPTSVKQDLVISCYKTSKEFETRFRTNVGKNSGTWDFLEQHLLHLPVHLSKGITTTSIVERSSKILYDRLITFYLMRDLPVPIDARDFQEGLKQKFIERDGMYFSSEQVAEYDEKKAKAPQFIQLSLIVTNESDAIEWLKDRLRKHAQKYQDIMPEFRIATQSLRKGDTLPELQDILNENFIQESDGKWRTPDPNEAKDREALRAKVLLKEFGGYVTAINQPRAKKLKEVRVEALRAGFKKCWEQKEFKTIVTLGDMIPQNILLEDEQLLMYYDIAKDRI